MTQPNPEPKVDPPSTIDDIPVDHLAVCIHCKNGQTERHIEDGSSVDVCRECGLRTLGFIVDKSLDVDVRPRTQGRTPEDDDRMADHDKTGLL